MSLLTRREHAEQVAELLAATFATIDGDDAPLSDHARTPTR